MVQRQNKKNRKVEHKNKTRVFLIIQALFILAVLGYLYFSSAPKAVFISGQSIIEPDVSFEVVAGTGEKIIVSRDPNFRNPIILEEGSTTNLPPGLYYWKSKNWLRESVVKTFEIKENVGLNLRIGDEKSILENAGNVETVVIEKKSGITSGTSLDVGGSMEADEEADYEGTKK